MTDQYFSMGFVNGHGLNEILASGPLSPKRAAELCAKIATAIEYAHANGVIHRDLKPANILLDENGEPRITDFGLAKQVESDSDLTRTGAVLGTPSYMPPEQASGVTEKTGRPPFQAANTLDILMQVINQEPVSPRDLNRQVPVDLETISLKCLEKNPENRIKSAGELNAELKRFLNDEPIKSRPTSLGYRTSKFVRKNKGLVASLSAIGLALLAASSEPPLECGMPIGHSNSPKPPGSKRRISRIGQITSWPRHVGMTNGLPMPTNCWIRSVREIANLSGCWPKVNSKAVW